VHDEGFLVVSALFPFSFFSVVFSFFLFLDSVLILAAVSGMTTGDVTLSWFCSWELVLRFFFFVYVSVLSLLSFRHVSVWLIIQFEDAVCRVYFGHVLPCVALLPVDGRTLSRGFF